MQENQNQATLLEASGVVPQRKLLSLQKSDVVLQTQLKIISSLIETEHHPIGCVDLTTVEPIADLAQFQKSTANFESNQVEADQVLDLVCESFQHSALTEQPA